MTENKTKEARRDGLIKLLEDREVLTVGMGELVDRLFNDTDFFTAPASTRWHAAYSGGLFDHCFGVTYMLLELTDRGVCNPWKREISPFVVGLLHDATKLGAYIPGLMTPYEHNPDHRLLSPVHGQDSVLKVVNELGFELTDEEAACIRWHTGAYEGKDSWTGYDSAIRRYPNVLWTHTADMYASKVLERLYEE